MYYGYLFIPRNCEPHVAVSDDKNLLAEKEEFLMSLNILEMDWEQEEDITLKVEDEELSFVYDDGDICTIDIYEDGEKPLVRFYDLDSYRFKKVKILKVIKES